MNVLMNTNMSSNMYLNMDTDADTNMDTNTKWLFSTFLPSLLAVGRPIDKIVHYIIYTTYYIILATDIHTAKNDF
jgi:hypothetical protein